MIKTNNFWLEKQLEPGVITTSISSQNYFDITVLSEFDCVSGCVGNKLEKIILKDHHLYGSNRLGYQEYNKALPLNNGNVVTNNFSSPEDVAGWVPFNTDAVVSWDANLGLRLQTSTQWGAIKKIIATQPGVRYRVKLGYVHGGSVGGGMEVYNGGVESTQSIGGSGWLNKTTERVFEFVPDSDMVMLKFFSGEVTGVEANMYLSKVEISIANSNHYSRIRGDKTYELSNHLGNVLATITDRKLGFSNNTSNNIASHYQAEVTSATDYYPFGSPMSKRRVFDYKSKYGFNSAEKHNELDNLDGLDYDLGARFYSSKLGRMFSPDPRESEYPWQSTYAYFSNSPISQVDINGEGGEGDKTTGQVTATVYFRFDSDVSLTPSQQQAYIDNFRANVQSVWNNQVLDNGVQVNVDNVQFLLAPATLTSASLLKNENLLTVGNGATANKDAEANVSYIDKNNHRNTGYMYYSFQGNEAAHEFGHMLGLSDRYFNGVIIDVAHFYRNGGESSINRFTIPIADINENGYNYLNNLMSRQSGNPLLTANQLNIAFNSNAKEEDYAKFSVVHSLTSVTTNGYDGLSIDGKNYYSQGNRKGYPPLTTYTKNNLQGLNSIDPMFLQRDTKNFILNNRTW